MDADKEWERIVGSVMAGFHNVQRWEANAKSKRNRQRLALIRSAVLEAHKQALKLQQK